MPRGKPLAKWEAEVLPEIRRQLDDFQHQGIDVTLREMFYTLATIKIIPFTQKAYHALSSQTVIWRENDKLPIDCFVDRTRGFDKDFDDVYETLDQYLNRAFDYLKDAHQDYTVPRWYKQPKYVEIWIEKDAPYESFKSMVRGKDVLVIPNKGHSSVAYLNSNVKRLKAKQAEGKKIVILYFGDMDPSGEEAPRVYLRKFVKPAYRIRNVEFIALGVNDKQANRFKLLKNPIRRL